MAPRAQRRGRRTRELLEVAWKKFHACETCSSGQSYDDLEDIIARLKVNRRERSRLERNLYCPNCGTQLSLFDRVAAYTQEDLKYIARSNKWKVKYTAECNSFHQFLIKTPALGGLHQTGQRLAKAIKKAPVLQLKPTVWYRACKAEEKQERRQEDFLPRDPQKVGVRDGRFNHARQFAYYVSDSPEFAAVETLKREVEAFMLERRKNPRSSKNVAGTVYVTSVNGLTSMTVLDLRRATFESNRSLLLPLLLEGLVHDEQVNKPVRFEDESFPQYRVPQYIADLVRWRMLDGILFTSSREIPFKPDVFGTNLVILNAEHAAAIRVVEILGAYRWIQATECPPFNLPILTLERVPVKSSKDA
jgi:hypothetical protein